MAKQLLFRIISIFLFISFGNIFTSKAQLVFPYNFGFEEGVNGSLVYGWSLGPTAIDSGFSAITSVVSPFQGNYCAKIINNDKKKINEGVASFFQRLDASIYINKKIRFSAFLKVEDITGSALARLEDDITSYIRSAPPILFINARNQRGTSIKSMQSYVMNKKGWNEVIVEMDIPENTVEIRVGVSFTDTSDIWVDNCSISIISNDSLYYEASNPLTPIELMYLVSFAKISGGVQYFHPSKVASEADWNNVLLAGIEQCKKINTSLYNEYLSTSKLIKPANSIIIDSLQSFYKQLAPQIIISKNSINNPKFSNDKHKYLLAWQHTGVPTNVKTNKMTDSRIVDLNGTLKYGDANVVQNISIKEAQNKELAITISAKLLKYHKGAVATINARFDDMEGNILSFSEKQEVNSENWTEYTIRCNVPDSAATLMIILNLRGYGRAFFDDVKAMYRDGNFANNLIIHNPGFEYKLDFNNNNWMISTMTKSSGYVVGYSNEEFNNGKQSLVIQTDATATPKFSNESNNYYTFNINFSQISFIDKFENNKNKEINTKLLSYLDFNKFKINSSFPTFVPAEFSEQSTKDSLNNNISVVTYETYPKSLGFKSFNGKNENFSYNWKDRASRLATIIKIYNLLAHFSLTDIDSNALDNAFIVALTNAAICNDKIQYRNILQQFVEIANDNRARVWFDGDDSYSYSLPFNVELVNNHLYISQIDSTNLNAISGIKVSDEIDISSLNINSDSIPFWNKMKKILAFKFGNDGSKQSFTLIHQNLQKTEFEMYRQTPLNKLQFRAVDYSQIIDDSILYIDLTKHNDKELNNVFDSLVKFKKFIFDLRGGETMTSEFFLSLLYNDYYSSSIASTPYFTMPSKKLMSFYKVFDYHYPAQTKHFEGDFIFLIDWKTYGYGELFASVVKDYKIGTLIGQPTQGTLICGVPIRLDVDFSLSLGTMYGYSPSDKPLLNAPIEPDIRVEPELNNIGTDYILQKAIEHLKNN